MHDDKRLVWDLPLRIFHWLFAASLLAAWATAKLGFAWMQWHFWIGYEVMGLLVFRVLWGIFGPKHSRFAHFLKGPTGVAGYVRSLWRARAADAAQSAPAGHNPLGALMVVLMLLLAALQVASGLFASDDIAWSGPYAASVADTMVKRLTALHDLNINLIWAAIALHVGAIIFYAQVKKINLVPAMLTGYKPAQAVPDGEQIESSELWKAAVVLAISSAIVYCVLLEAPPAASALY
jgi:cytochrome b